MRVPRKILSSLLAVSLAAAIFAAPSNLSAVSVTHYVNLNSPNPTSPFTNWSTAATNIQAAIDAATAGDLILVTNGTYAIRRVRESLMRSPIAWSSAKPSLLASVNGPAVTVIQGTPPFIQGFSYNGTNAMRCVYMAANTVLSGFTLTGGGTSNAGNATNDESGGGVWCTNTSAIVTNCVVSGNFAYFSGGGIFSGAVLNSVINSNDTAFNISASSGGGAYGSTLSNCVITANTGSSSGGGAAWGTLSPMRREQQHRVFPGR